MGVPNVWGLKNGTAGWLLAGRQLETGADRVGLPAPSPEGVAAAEAYAKRLALEDGVRFVDVPALAALLERAAREPMCFVDVRTAEEHAAGHIPGFRWFPGGQAVQRSDEVAVVRNCPIRLRVRRHGTGHDHRVLVPADGLHATSPPSTAARRHGRRADARSSAAWPTSGPPATTRRGRR